MNAEVKAYFAAVPDDRREMVEQLHRIIIGLYPKAQVDMSYRMPTYRAKEGWVAVANQKRYVSFYTCSAEHLADFKQKYPQIKTGKGCISFKPTDNVPVTALKKVVRHAIEHPKAGC